MMLMGRGMRGLAALLLACLPALLFWLLTAATLELHKAAQSASPVPNPLKPPAWFPGPLDVLVYADSYFMGTIVYQWLLPGSVLLVLLSLWAAGIPIMNKVREPGWPVPRLQKLIAISLATGVFLSVPWLYAWARILWMP